MGIGIRVELSFVQNRKPTKLRMSRSERLKMRNHQGFFSLFSVNCKILKMQVEKLTSINSNYVCFSDKNTKWIYLCIICHKIFNLINF